MDETKTNIQIEVHSASEPDRTSYRFRASVCCLCLVSVMTSLDSVLMAVILSKVAEDLDATTTESFWCGTGFLLAQTVTIPLYGSLGEVYGNKAMISTAIFLFTIGSVVCATAATMGYLITGRVVQGSGAGGTLSLVSVIISEMTSLRERGSYMALTAMAWAVGVISGLPIGGAIGQTASWRLAFWINLPVCCVSFIGLLWSLRDAASARHPPRKLWEMDFGGMAILAMSSISLLLGITMGGTIFPWSSANIILAVIVGVIGLIAFVWFERRSKSPMLPLDIFGTVTASVGFFSTFIHGLVLWCLAYYLIVFFLGVLHHGLLHASIDVLPTIAPTAPMAMISGIICRKTLRFQKLLWAGWIFFTTGMGLMILMDATSSAGILYVLPILAGVGAGLLFPANMFAVQAPQEDSKTSMATSMGIFMRSFGQVFGVAIGGVIFQNRFEALVTDLVDKDLIQPNMLIPGSCADAAYSMIDAFPSPIQMRYEEVYAKSLHVIWIVMTSLSASALVSVFAVKDLSLDKGSQRTN